MKLWEVYYVKEKTMPLKSSQQRRYFYSQLPKLAPEWEKETPEGKLPKYVRKTKKKKRKTMAEQTIDTANRFLGEEEVVSPEAISVSQVKGKNPAVVDKEIAKIREDMKKDSLYIKAHDSKTQPQQRDKMLADWNKKVNDRIRQKYGLKKTVALEDDAGGVAPSSPAITTTSINNPSSDARFGSSVYASKMGMQKRRVPVAEAYIDSKLGIV